MVNQKLKTRGNLSPNSQSSFCPYFFFKKIESLQNQANWAKFTIPCSHKRMRTLLNTANLLQFCKEENSILLLAEETGDSFTLALHAKYILNLTTHVM